MTSHPREGSGLGAAPMQVISYCEGPQREWQLSVPPDTPPSGRTVAPLLTWQIAFAGAAKHPEPDGSESTSTLAG
jgi:hypothetical protein